MGVVDQFAEYAGCSSQVDTTSVQALVDARVEIEKWTECPVEFHFATILSPWIRRSLVAGGFGYDRGSQHPLQPHDVAAIEQPYDALQIGPSSTDIEAVYTKDIAPADPSYGAIYRSEAPAVQVDTPYFHLDLAEAVAAAEAGLSKLSSKSRTPSLTKEEDAFGIGQRA
jgi:sodium-independent sulfate anion transporter 11